MKFSLASPASGCIDIVHNGCDHFDRMRFVQERYSQLQLDPRKWSPFDTPQMKQLRHHLTELAGREGSVVDGKLEEALDYKAGVGGVAASVPHWKPRGSGASGSRLSSDASLEPSAKRKRSRK